MLTKKKSSLLHTAICYFRVFLLGFTICVASVSTQITSATSFQTILNAFRDKSYFYNPEGDNCDPNPVDNGLYKGAQYSFSKEQLKRLIWAARAEQGTLNGIKTELSIFANLTERDGGEPGNNTSLIDKIVHRYHTGSGWFAKSTGQAYETGCSPWECYGEPSSEEYAAAEDILNNGNRFIPPEVDEHDSISDISSVSNDGNGFSPSDKANYKSGVTVIHNKMGSTYTFFQWANGEKECTSDYGACGDPFGYTGDAPSTTQSYSTVTTVGNNTLYDGSKVLSDAQLQQVEHNKPIYEKIAKKYNFPWQLLAAIHYREHNFAVSNPDNGEGIYQLTSLTNHGSNEYAFRPAGPVTDEEFERQTDLAAQVIRGKIGNDTDLMENDGNIKRVMFMYNWANPAYIKRAIDMGYKEEDAKNGEGSPYVMNMYDAERDPGNADVSEHWTGLIASLRGNVVPDNRPGAFVVFQALGGGTNENGDAYCETPGSNGEIADTAILLSWDCGSASGCHSQNGPPYEPKPEYVRAMQQVGTYDNPGGWGYGASCDRFVATVMRYSGADPNFPIGYANDSGIYLISHPELYKEITSFDGTNPDVLEPGDIFSTYAAPGQSGGHIWIYVKINNEHGRADASNGSSSGRTAEHYTRAPIINDGRPYKVFRRIK